MRVVLRIVLTLLLAANFVAAYLVLRPIGGSPQDLLAQENELRAEIRQKQSLLDRTRNLASKIETGRTEGDKFTDKYFLSRRTAYSTLMSELNRLAGEAKITPRENSFALEPVEGSDTFEMMTISAAFEGTYQDLIRFVSLLDRVDRLLVVESLNATPETGTKKLSVLLKLDTFVKEDAAGL
jgi:Tfp pilus assembly protein PilO